MEHQEIFTSATLKICLFHALAAVDKRLAQAKLRRNLREEIYQKFQEAVCAASQEKITEIEEFLCGLGRRFTHCLRIFILNTISSFLTLQMKTTKAVHTMDSGITLEPIGSM